MFSDQGTTTQAQVQVHPANHHQVRLAVHLPAAVAVLQEAVVLRLENSKT